MYDNKKFKITNIYRDFKLIINVSIIYMYLLHCLQYFYIKKCIKKLIKCKKKKKKVFYK